MFEVVVLFRPEDFSVLFENVVQDIVCEFDDLVLIDDVLVVFVEECGAFGVAVLVLTVLCVVNEYFAQFKLCFAVVLAVLHQREDLLDVDVDKVVLVLERLFVLAQQQDLCFVLEVEDLHDNGA